MYSKSGTLAFYMYLYYYLGIQSTRLTSYIQSSKIDSKRRTQRRTTMSRPSAVATPAAAQGGGGGADDDGHAVDRSSELLSCARSALQMGQDHHRRRQQLLLAGAGGDDPSMNAAAAAAAAAENDDSGSPDLPEELLSISPMALHLHKSAPTSSQSTDDDPMAALVMANPQSESDDDDLLVTDALRLLSALDATTLTLSGLVRRRGHTNDPTQRINETIGEFDELAKELMDMVEQVKREGTMPLPLPESVNTGRGRSGRRSRISQQRLKHYEHVASDLSSMADERIQRFKKMLEVREKVIREQNERRKMLNPTTSQAAANKSKGIGGLAVGANNSKNIGNKPGGGVAPTSGGVAATLAARTSLAAGARSGVSQLSSPLFTASPPPPPRSAAANTTHTVNAANALSSRPQHSARPSSLASGIGRPPTAPGTGTSTSTSVSAQPQQSNAYTGGYSGCGSGGGGYGGSGMRQRRANAPGSGGGLTHAQGQVTTNTSSGYGGYSAYGGYGGYQQHQRDASSYNLYSGAAGDAKKTDGDDTSAAAVQSSIQTRRARRETAARLEQARNAERTLANLGTMFSKMADLVVAQGETIEKVEDDVEAARVDINAGHEEIQKLYGITKGNRGLILKTFGILIALIIFMRFY